MKTEMKELNLGELEQASGGWVPIIIFFGAAAATIVGEVIYDHVKSK